MRFDKRYQIDAATSDDVTRPAIKHVKYDVEGKRLIATNGHILATVPCIPETNEKSAMLAPAVISAARKVKGRTDADIDAGPVFHGVAGVRHPLPLGREGDPLKVSDFPEWQRVMPKFKRGDDGVHTVCFNPRLLLELAKALGVKDGEGVILSFTDAEKKGDGFDNASPIAVTPEARHGDGEQPHGVLMPMRFK